MNRSNSSSIGSGVACRSSFHRWRSGDSRSEPPCRRSNNVNCASSSKALLDEPAVAPGEFLHSLTKWVARLTRSRVAQRQEAALEPSVKEKRCQSDGGINLPRTKGRPQTGFLCLRHPAARQPGHPSISSGASAITVVANAKCVVRPVEGMDNKVKLTKRTPYGFRTYEGPGRQLNQHLTCGEAAVVTRSVIFEVALSSPEGTADNSPVRQGGEFDAI